MNAEPFVNGLADTCPGRWRPVSGPTATIAKINLLNWDNSVFGRAWRMTQEATCCHLAGHAVASHVLGGRVTKIAVSRTEADLLFSDGVCLRTPLRSLADMMVVALAGMEAAHRIVDGRAPTSADYRGRGDGDGDQVVTLGRLLAEEQGRRPVEVIRVAVRRAQRLVFEHQSAIVRLAEELLRRSKPKRAVLRRRSLTSDDLDALLGPMTANSGVDTAQFVNWLSAKDVSVMAFEGSLAPSLGGRH